MRRTMLAALAITTATTALAACASTPNPSASPTATDFSSWFDGGGYQLALELGIDMRTLLGPKQEPADQLEVCKALGEHITAARRYGPIPDADKQLHWKQMLDHLDRASSECAKGADQPKVASDLEAAQRESNLLAQALNPSASPQ
jgi:hypothetical protein